MSRSTANSLQVLHVDDEPELANLVVEFLERTDERFTVQTVTSATEGLGRLADHQFDCIVSDYDMPGLDGIEFLEQVREEYPDLPFVLFTGKGSEEIASEAISAGVTDYLQKRSGASQYELLATRIENAVEKHRAQHEVAALEDRLRTIAEHSNDILWQFTADWSNLLFINSAYEEVWGQSTTELREEPKSFLEGVHPDDRSRVQEVMEELSTGHSVNIEYRVNPGEDYGRWVWVQAEPVFDDAGDVATIVGFARDVTERKERESELEHFETIVRAVPDEVYTADANGILTSVIPPTGYDTSISGYEPDELVGEYVSKVMDDDDIAKGQEVISELLRSEDRERMSFEMDLVSRDGERIPHENHIALLPTEAPGGFRGSVGILRDISEREEAERELRRQNERLEEFTSVVSHDLRNPLAIATGELELAQQECDSDRLDAVKQAHDRMERLIDDLLTLAREGESVLEIESVNHAETTIQCWQTVATEEATLLAETDRTIRADPARFRRLLENLLRNTVEHGGEDVRVTIGDMPDGFYVADDGPGISPNKREQVFESGYSTADVGTGIGLNIVSEITAAHDWSIRVTESEAGGARFVITGVEFTR